MRLKVNCIQIRFNSTFIKHQVQEFNKLPSFAKPRKESSNLVWNSTIVLLGWALEKKYGDKCYIVSSKVSNGFYMDVLLLDHDTSKKYSGANSVEKKALDLVKTSRPIFIQKQDLSELKKMILKQKNVEWKQVDHTQALNVFSKNPFKLLKLKKLKGDLCLVKVEDYVDIFEQSFNVDFDSLKALDFTSTGTVQLSASELHAAPETSTEDFIQSIENTSNEIVNRIQGISFDSKDAQKQYQQMMLNYSKRNHRKIGARQELFYFNEFAPGHPFFLPHGLRIVQALKCFLRKEYLNLRMDEVVTPLIFNKSLWEVSGHWALYKDDMFVLENDRPIDSEIGHISAKSKEAVIGAGSGRALADRSRSTDLSLVSKASKADIIKTFESNGCCGTKGLKPMNCPAHCLIYKTKTRSYRDLPLRLAEFTPLHRNESSGALTGLTRVVKFHQDDGHIFCTPSQVYLEIQKQLQFVKKTYAILGFNEYRFLLSTRPDSFLGKKEDWDRAEESLQKALEENGGFELNIGDGAFYGPKIDIMIKDSMGREHQTATIQLDFQLPKRFELEYVSQTGDLMTPVMIHRAVLGSIERMLAILIEQYAGEFPFWLSPRQVMIVTTRDEVVGYAKDLEAFLKSNGFYVDLDDSDKTLGKKIQMLKGMGYNYILVIGDKEVESNTCSVRERDGTTSVNLTKEELLQKFSKLIETKALK